MSAVEVAKPAVNSTENQRDGLCYLLITSLLTISSGVFFSVLEKIEAGIPDQPLTERMALNFFCLCLIVGGTFGFLGFLLLWKHDRVQRLKEVSVVVTAFQLIPGLAISIVTSRMSLMPDVLSLALGALVSLIVVRPFAPVDNPKNEVIKSGSAPVLGGITAHMPDQKH